MIKKYRFINLLLEIMKIMSLVSSLHGRNIDKWNVIVKFKYLLAPNIEVTIK